MLEVKNIGGVVAVNEKTEKPEARFIRFISPNYKEKFRILDGGSIRLTFKDGEKKVKVCRFIDPCHLFVGNNAYHICEFSEMCQNRGITVEPEYVPRVIPPEIIDLKEEDEYIFFPGVIHGTEWQLYWVYFNPNAVSGNGAFEVCHLDAETILEADKATEDLDRFYDALIDISSEKHLWYVNENSTESTLFQETFDALHLAKKISQPTKKSPLFRATLVHWAKSQQQKN